MDGARNLFFKGSCKVTMQNGIWTQNMLNSVSKIFLRINNTEIFPQDIKMFDIVLSNEPLVLPIEECYCSEIYNGL